MYPNNKPQPVISATRRLGSSWFRRARVWRLSWVYAVALLGWGCTPTVKVATDEPITINLNVNIKHEILVKAEKDLEDLFSDDSELF